MSDGCFITEMEKTFARHFDRLVLISYRLPFRVYRNKVVQNSGGLVSAILALVQKGDTDKATRLGNEVVWIGKSDETPEEWAKVQGQTGPFNLVPVQIEDKLNENFYGGFCNDMIWPMFHYFSSLANFDSTYFDAYLRANNAFLEQVSKIIRPTDLVWIHDYHLMLLPGMVRSQFPNAQVGFFLHIPFPSFEIFRLIPRPWRQAILRGILGADLIGFHTFDYTQYFLRAVSRTLGMETTPNSVILEDRFVKAECFPLGIDYGKFSEVARSGSVDRERQKLRSILGNKKLIFSVDRLDYSKGLQHRLRGFEYFLEKYPQWREKIVFNMVVVPSRDTIARYREMKKEIEADVGRINGKYGSMAWIPLVYEYRSLPFAEMVALYSASDVGLITPLRDGMNLVAKEYLACQKDSPGVLILSEMTGAAAELSEAILINPTDKGEMAAAINQALAMPESERQVALGRMQNRLRTYDVFSWARDFFDMMGRSKQEQQARRIRLISPAIEDRIMQLGQEASHRMILLDYDGTLVPFSRYPESAVPGERVMTMLEQLAADPRNTIAIISGRERDFLDKWFGDMKIVLVAEHGAFIRMPPDNWSGEQDADPTWKQQVLPVLQRYAERCTGAFIDEKTLSLVWHYRNSDPGIALLRSQELKDELREIISHDGKLQVMEGHKIIEIKRAGYDKGTVALKLLSMAMYDFILAIGDDKTDEDLFAVLPAEATTIKIGLSPSLAKYNLKDQGEVARLMDRLLEADTGGLLNRRIAL
jgi:trehalose 6-phosphate synthase/phosphatase